MYVDRIMTREVVKATADTRVTQLAALMRERGIRHLPVVDAEEAVVGVVSRGDLERVSPSPATTLSVGEVNYLLGRMTAEQVMQREVVTCTPETLVEEAAGIMRARRIGCLPVTRGHRLVGIVTMEDLTDFFLDVTGCNVPDTTRIAVHLPDRTGQLGGLLAAINAAGGYIATVVSPLHPDETGMRIAIVRFRADDPRAVDARLREQGYDLISENLPAGGEA